eukprot:jgi/Botrbrau1/7456/Bobra.0083s0022.2
MALVYRFDLWAGKPSLQPSAATHMFSSTASLEQIDAARSTERSLSSSMEWGADLQPSVESDEVARINSGHSIMPRGEDSINVGSWTNELECSDMVDDTHEGALFPAPSEIGSHQVNVSNISMDETQLQPEELENLSSEVPLMDGRDRICMSDNDRRTQQGGILGMDDALKFHSVTEGVTRPVEAIVNAETTETSIMHDQCREDSRIVREATHLPAADKGSVNSRVGTGGASSCLPVHTEFTCSMKGVRSKELSLSQNVCSPARAPWLLGSPLPHGLPTSRLRCESLSSHPVDISSASEQGSPESLPPETARKSRFAVTSEAVKDDYPDGAQPFHILSYAAPDNEAVACSLVTANQDVAEPAFLGIAQPTFPGVALPNAIIAGAADWHIQEKGAADPFWQIATQSNDSSPPDVEGPEAANVEGTPPASHCFAACHGGSGVGTSWETRFKGGKMWLLESLRFQCSAIKESNTTLCKSIDPPSPVLDASPSAMPRGNLPDFSRTRLIGQSHDLCIGSHETLPELLQASPVHVTRCDWGSYILSRGIGNEKGCDQGSSPRYDSSSSGRSTTAAQNDACFVRTNQHGQCLAFRGMCCAGFSDGLQPGFKGLDEARSPGLGHDIPLPSDEHHVRYRSTSSSCSQSDASCSEESTGLSSSRSSTAETMDEKGSSPCSCTSDRVSRGADSGRAIQEEPLVEVSPRTRTTGGRTSEDELDYGRGLNPGQGYQDLSPELKQDVEIPVAAITARYGGEPGLSEALHESSQTGSKLESCSVIQRDEGLPEEDTLAGNWVLTKRQRAVGQIVAGRLRAKLLSGLVPTPGLEVAQLKVEHPLTCSDQGHDLKGADASKPGGSDAMQCFAIDTSENRSKACNQEHVVPSTRSCQRSRSSISASLHPQSPGMGFNKSAIVSTAPRCLAIGQADKSGEGGTGRSIWLPTGLPGGNRMSGPSALQRLAQRRIVHRLNSLSCPSTPARSSDHIQQSDDGSAHAQDHVPPSKGSQGDIRRSAGAMERPQTSEDPVSRHPGCMPRGGSNCQKGTVDCAPCEVADHGSNPHSLLRRQSYDSGSVGKLDWSKVKARTVSHREADHRPKPSVRLKGRQSSPRPLSALSCQTLPKTSFHRAAFGDPVKGSQVPASGKHCTGDAKARSPCHYNASYTGAQEYDSAEKSNDRRPLDDILDEVTVFLSQVNNILNSK